MIEYRKLHPDELRPELFADFQRFQKVEKCWRKVDGRWVLKDIAFTEDWGQADFRRLCGQMAQALKEGGTVWGALWNGSLKGFASLEGKRIGSRGQYAVLAELHVSQDCRRRGLGRELFLRAAESARTLGAEKLYISTMSAEESQAFYLSMGCVEAEEPDPNHVELEPCDVQREFLLAGGAGPGGPSF